MATATSSSSTTIAATTETSSSHFKVQTAPQSVKKPKRRRFKETTISGAGEIRHPPTIDSNPCCFPKPISPPPSVAKIRDSTASQSPVMDFTNGHHSPYDYATSSSSTSTSYFPSSFSKFNSALTAGLLNPMSPPPPPSVAAEKSRSSPTLFEMMANEPEINPKTTPNHNNVNMLTQNRNFIINNNNVLPVQDRQGFIIQRINDLLTCKSPGNQFNDSFSSDVRLTLSSKDGISVSMSVHKQNLVAHSRFFAVKLSDGWSKHKAGAGSSSAAPCIVEISDCDDVEVYIETLRLMYCKDLRRRLMREDVNKVLGILKVSAAIGFDAGVLSCLEYLEAAPWAEDEEEKVASLLSELRLEGVGAGEVLKRVSVDVTNNGPEDNSDNQEVLLKLLNVVLEGKDEKARREMKGLVLKMLRENSSHNDLRKESLYSSCNECLQLLRHNFLQAAAGDLKGVGQISRQADNLHWMLDILIDRQIAEDFLKSWASQNDLAEVHSKVPAVHRYEISRVTSRLFVGIGKGQLLASKDVRCLLLKTWLVPFYDDFGWMRRALRGLDRHLIEDGLSNTILTLPLAWQQDILLGWFNRFLNSGEDCPNIQRGFEAWWRRAFWRRNGEQEQPRQVRITTIDNLLKN